jgi:hypothetical protein
MYSARAYNCSSLYRLWVAGALSVRSEVSSSAYTELYRPTSLRISVAFTPPTADGLSFCRSSGDGAWIALHLIVTT